MTASKRKYDYLDLFSIREKERLNSLNRLEIDQFQKELESFHPISQISKTKKKSPEKKKERSSNIRKRGEIQTEIENTEERIERKKEELEWKEKKIEKKEEKDLEVIRKKEEGSFEKFLMRGKKWEQLMLEKQMRRKLKYGDNSLFSPMKTTYKGSKSRVPKSLPIEKINEKILVSLEDVPAVQNNEVKQGQKEDMDGSCQIEINSINQAIQLKTGGKMERKYSNEVKKEKKCESLRLNDNIYKKCLEKIMKMN